MSIIDEQNKQGCVELFQNLLFATKQRDRNIIEMRLNIEKLKENPMYSSIFTELQQKYVDCLISQCNAIDNLTCSIE